MNYEEAFRHYKEGTATEEERAFVQDEIAKAKALSTLLDDEALAVKPAPIKEADAKEVREAKQQLIWKRVLVSMVTFLVLIVILGAVLGGVFGAAAAYGRNFATVSAEDARLVAEAYAFEQATKGHTTTVNGKPVTVVFPSDGKLTAEPLKDVSEKFNFETNLVDSYYVYRVEVEGYDPVNRLEWEYEIDVNSRTGACSVHKVDLDR